MLLRTNFSMIGVQDGTKDLAIRCEQPEQSGSPFTTKQRANHLSPGPRPQRIPGRQANRAFDEPDRPVQEQDIHAAGMHRVGADERVDVAEPGFTASWRCRSRLRWKRRHSCAGVRRRRVNPIRSRMPPARAIRTGIVFRTIHGSRRMRIRPVQDRAAKSRSWSVIQGG